MGLNIWYRDLLTRFLGFTVTETGDVMQAGVDGKLTPVIIVNQGNKKVMLPTSKVLNDIDWNTQIAFHPLSEIGGRQESVGLRSFRSWVWVTIQSRYCDLLMQMITIALNTDSHKQLPPEGLEFLKEVKGVKKTTVEGLRDVLGKVGLEPLNRLVSITVKNGGTSSGFRRQSTVSFPIFSQVNEEGDPKAYFGVNVGVVNKQLIINLMNYVFGDEEKRTSYSSGSNSDVAPYFMATLASAKRLMDNWNTHVNNLGTLTTLRPIDTSCLMMSADDLSLFAKEIPVLPGFDGEVEGQAKLQSVQSATSQPANQPTSAKGKSIAELMGNIPPPNTMTGGVIGNQFHQQSSGSGVAALLSQAGVGSNNRIQGQPQTTGLLGGIGQGVNQGYNLPWDPNGI